MNKKVPHEGKTKKKLLEKKTYRKSQ